MNSAERRAKKISIIARRTASIWSAFIYLAMVSASSGCRGWITGAPYRRHQPPSPSASAAAGAAFPYSRCSIFWPACVFWRVEHAFPAKPNTQTVQDDPLLAAHLDHGHAALLLPGDRDHLLRR